MYGTLSTKTWTRKVLHLTWNTNLVAPITRGGVAIGTKPSISVCPKLGAYTTNYNGGPHVCIGVVTKPSGLGYT
jgi:hypothetical protein